MHATKLPMAGGGPRGSTRWSPAGWKSEKTLTSLGGRRKLKPILLLNRGTKDGLKATEGQRGEQIHREHKGTTTATCAEAAHLTRKHNSSTCQILPEARQESAPPATGAPGIPERSNGVKSAMDGDTPRVVGRVPDQVRGKRTTQGASARGPRPPSSACWMDFFHVKIKGYAVDPLLIW